MGSETLVQKLNRMDGLLDSKQVIGILGVHICTLQIWTRRGEIPFLRVGRSCVSILYSLRRGWRNVKLGT